MAKLDELHNYAYPDNYLDELHIYDKKLGSNGIDEIHNYGNRGVTYGMDELHLYGSYQTEETSIDEVNKPDKKYEVIDIDEYFDEIEVLDEEQKEERKELANEFKDIMMLIFMLMLADLRVGNPLDEGFYHSLAKSRLMDAVDRVMPSLTADIYVEIENYINQNLNYVIETTITHSDQPYMFSEARATSLAVDDSLASFNIEELNEAIKAGYKYKIWTSMRDRKVRHSHEVADGQKVEITKPFKVGRCLMTAPMVFDEKSVFQDAKEVVNCRCQLIYSFSKDEKETLENEESRKTEKALEPTTRVDMSMFSEKRLNEFVESLGETTQTGREVKSTIKSILKHRDGTFFEDLGYVATNRRKSIINKDYDYYDAIKGVSACKPSKPMNELLENEPKGSIIGIHNHAKSQAPSDSDILMASKRNYKYGLAVCHNGTIYKYHVNQDYDSFNTHFYLDNLNNAVYNNNAKDIADSISHLKESGVDMEIFR